MALGTELIGALVGAAVGVAVGYGNMRITKRAMRKDAATAIMATNMIRMLINFAVLLVIFLLRKVSPLGFVGTLLGAAVGLSVGNIYFIVRLSRQWSESALAESEKRADGENESGGASSNEI
jgi:arginine exporter protein ArgO